MPRYASIITGDDGREIVSAIGEFEGAGPVARLGRVEAVAPGVLIGMVRDAAGGFCFPQAGIGAQLVGLAMARLKAARPLARPAQAAKPKRGGKARKKSARSKKRARQAPPKAAAGDVNVGARTHDW
ncbi:MULTISPECIES: hypothetical protein [unclassified Mesorhizobium]|uniref:hypothetical protein n=1 Tax=unclassified Mesorhizobium TaxID=325217 RepID=UPI001CCCC4C4|nr:MULTISPECIES: hypothetical protein [unclassified Mesorhizobium]MBZ9681684.1 hypothetical protein [Mesorhizobium sp. CO1-1-2]MBZ9926434.1 hypothetical protein [Mesorhizobium sp. BR1-1-4]